MTHQPTDTIDKTTRRKVLQSLGLATMAMSPLKALSQSNLLPIDQVKIICGFPAGGTADTTS